MTKGKLRDSFLIIFELVELAHQQQTYFRANVNPNLSDKNKNTHEVTYDFQKTLWRKYRSGQVAIILTRKL